MLYPAELRGLLGNISALKTIDSGAARPLNARWQRGYTTSDDRVEPCGGIRPPPLSSRTYFSSVIFAYDA